MIKNMIQDGCTEDAIPLTNVDSNTLAMVLEYLNKHGDSGVSEEDKKNFDSEFVKKELDALFHLTLAANYMEIKKLLDLLCQSIANLIRDRSVEEVRSIFGIENDFTPEEEEAIRKENAWAFDD
jgi:S-phase kinase-associated protein 1